jgi:multiple sugar transport system ATP-binding protein
VFFGVRPEDMLYSKAPSALNNIPVKVTIIEPLGAETHLYVATKTQQLIARSSPDHEYKIGEVANFTPNLEKSKFFDKETETNICEDVKAT